MPRARPHPWLWHRVVPLARAPGPLCRLPLTKGRLWLSSPASCLFRFLFHQAWGGEGAGFGGYQRCIHISEWACCARTPCERVFLCMCGPGRALNVSGSGCRARGSAHAHAGERASARVRVCAGISCVWVDLSPSPSPCRSLSFPPLGRACFLSQALSLLPAFLPPPCLPPLRLSCSSAFSPCPCQCCRGGGRSCFPGRSAWENMLRLFPHPPLFPLQATLQGGGGGQLLPGKRGCTGSTPSLVR